MWQEWIGVCDARKREGWCSYSFITAPITLTRHRQRIRQMLPTVNTANPKLYLQVLARHTVTLPGTAVHLQAP